MTLKPVMAAFIACWVAFPTLSEATTLAKLGKPDRPSHFILEQDHVRISLEGLLKVKWVQGLRAGTYEAVAQDAKGIYYMGPGTSVIMLRQKFAENYLTKGEIPSEDAGGAPKVGTAPGVGGLFIPTDLTKDEPKLFFILKSPPGGVGLVMGIIATLIDGTVDYVSFGTERDFVTGLKILDP
jgi:hypothetical protein